MKFSDRSTDYRQVFFKNNKPAFGQYYICSYCGRFLRRKDVTVDHLYPVNAAKKSIWVRTLLRCRGLNTINDVKNLVPACEKCNKVKSSRMGIWIIRGRIGRHKTIWIIRYILRVALIIAAVIIFTRSGIIYQMIQMLKYFI